MKLASRIAVNTTLAAAAGGLTSLSCNVLLGHPGDISPVLNGILAGEPCFQACFSPELHVYPAIHVSVYTLIDSLLRHDYIAMHDLQCSVHSFIRPCSACVGHPIGT